MAALALTAFPPGRMRGDGRIGGPGGRTARRREAYLTTRAARQDDLRGTGGRAPAPRPPGPRGGGDLSGVQRLGRIGRRRGSAVPRRRPGGLRNLGISRPRRGAGVNRVLWFQYRRAA